MIKWKILAKDIISEELILGWVCVCVHMHTHTVYECVNSLQE